MAETIVFRRNDKKTLPEKIASIMDLLEADLRKYNGKPAGQGWENYGPYRQMGKNFFHCHLDYRHVAVWEVVQAPSGDCHCYIRYVGTRENMPTRKR